MTTKSGLMVRRQLDINQYTKGVKVTDKELRKVRIGRNTFHGESNYTIKATK